MIGGEALQLLAMPVLGSSDVATLGQSVYDSEEFSINKKQLTKKLYGGLDPEEQRMHIISSLVESLRTQNYEARAKTAEALRTIGPDTISDLSKALQSGQLYAADALRIIGPDAVPALCDALTSNYCNVSIYVIETLAEMGPGAATAVPALINVLRGHADKEKYGASEALEMIGPVAVPALITALQDEDSAVRLYAALVLGNIGPASAPALPSLRNALQDEDTEVRVRAIDALGRLGPEAIPALCEALWDREIAEIKNSDENGETDEDADSEEKEKPEDNKDFDLQMIVEMDANEKSNLYEMQDGNSQDVRIRAVNALIAIGTDAVPALITALGHPAAKVRWYVAYALGQIGANAILALSQALRNRDDNVRRCAAYALFEIGSSAKQAIPALSDAVRDQNYEVRRNAAFALLTIDPSAEPAAVVVLCSELKNSWQQVRGGIARSMAMIGPAAAPAIPDLISVFREDQIAWVRSAAAYALGRIGPAALSAIPVLITGMQDSFSDVRASAARALGMFGPAAISAIPALTDGQRDTDSEQTRLNATAALAQIAPDAIIHTMSTALGDPSREIRRYAADTLIAVGLDAILALCEALKNQAAEVRKDAVDALGKMGPDAASAIPAVINALRDKYWIVQQSAAEALGKIRSGAILAVPALIDALADQNNQKEVRMSAITALGQFGTDAALAIPALSEVFRNQHAMQGNVLITLGNMGPSALPVLISALGTESEYVQTRAADAMAMIGADAIPHLSEALRLQGGSVRRYAADALRKIGPDAIPALSEALGDTDAVVRKHATDALEKLGTDAIPALLTTFRQRDQTVYAIATELLKALQSSSQLIIDGLSAFAMDANESLTVRGRAIALIEYFDPAAATAITEATHAIKEDRVPKGELEAYTMMSQLKLFYLLGRLYKEGKTSVRSVTKALRGFEHKLFAEGLPVSNVSISDNTEQLAELFGKILEKESVTIFVKRPGLGNQFSDDAWQAWEWADDFLKRHLPAEWFGFSRLTPLEKPESKL